MPISIGPRPQCEVEQNEEKQRRTYERLEKASRVVSKRNPSTSANEVAKVDMKATPAFSLCVRLQGFEPDVPRQEGLLERGYQRVVRWTKVRGKGNTHTGGEGLWKRVFTCWVHFSLWQKVPPM